MDVAEWLRGLGLERYAPAFRDNDIDEMVLRRLTGEDLRELELNRPPPPTARRYLRARAVSPHVASTAVSHDIPPLVEAERRQLNPASADNHGRR